MKVTIQDTRTSVTVQPRDFKVAVSGARGPQGPPGEAGASEWGDIGGTLSNQTDLQTALDAKVPYTGATQDVNLGEYGAQLGNLEFDNTPTNVPTTAGSVYWNDTDGTLNIVLKGGQTISRVGETQHIRALNNTGAQIARGKVVYVVGAQGQRLTIALADADTEILSKDTIGFTAEAIADGAEGFVIVQGVINNVSTTGMTDGATVYLSQTAGSYTTTPPADPAHLVILGFIVNGGSGGAGSIYVKVDNGYELEELHNISDSAKTTPVADDALLLRDSADNNLWKRLTWTNALAGVKSHMDTFKSVAGGYASLDGSGKVPSSELPSYVDDVVEVANYAALPGTGETGKIYVTLDTNKCYRWSGSVYVQVAQGVDTLTTTGTSGAATLVGSTLNIPQYQGVLTNPVTGTGTAGQVAYFSGTSAVTGSSAFLFSPISELDLANSISASSAIARGARIRPTLTASANNDTLVALDIAPTFSTSSFTGVASYGLRSSSADALIRNFVISSGQINYQGTNTQIIGFSNQFFIINSGASGFIQLQAQGASGTIRFASGGTTEHSRILANGNWGIGTTASTAKMHIVGSGTTSATTALLVQNSTPSELFRVYDSGNVMAGTSAPSTGVKLETDGVMRAWTSLQCGQFGQLIINTTSLTKSVSGSDFFEFSNNSSQSAVSGTYYFLQIRNTVNPTSGTAAFNNLNLNATINQTGGANGITRGLYINPVLTAAADWRSIETSNNTGYAIYTAGTANSYFGGGIGIGTATLNNSSLRINRAVTGSTIVSSISNASTINSDVTSNAWMYVSGPSTQAATFNLGELVHFNAFNITLGANSTISNQAGFNVSSNIIGATNNYGFRGQIASGTGRWNIYMDGTAANYLAGNTSIGTTTESARLHVRGSGTTSATTALLVQNSTPTANFTIRDDGGYAFRGGTVGLAQTGYTTFTNLTTDRTCDANATTVEELADILGTLIEDLKTKGIIAA